MKRCEFFKLYKDVSDKGEKVVKVEGYSITLKSKRGTPITFCFDKLYSGTCNCTEKSTGTHVCTNDTLEAFPDKLVKEGWVDLIEERMCNHPKANSYKQIIAQAYNAESGKLF